MGKKTKPVRRIAGKGRPKDRPPLDLGEAYQDPENKARRQIEPSAQQIANLANVSLTLVHRKLAQGKTPRQIVAEALGRENQAPRDLVTPSHNGHASNIPSYAESQAVKEYHLAALRGIEVEIRRRALYPLQPLRAICFTALNHLRNRFAALPDELSQEFGMEHAAILRSRIGHIFDEAARVAQRECEKYGAPWPEDNAA